MPSIIWSGTISFVMVSIPVDIVSAARPGKVSFHLMHKEDNSPIRVRMFCPHENKVVGPEHIVDGYQIGEERYVTINEEEYRALEPQRSQTIEISSFTDLDSINPLYVYKSYYVLPRKGGAKAYQLLLDVLKDTRKAGIARLVLKSREHLVAVRPHSRVLGLMFLHFPEEIRDPEEIVPSNIKAEQQKVKLLTATLNGLKADYRPETFEDTRFQKVMSFIEKKAKQQGTVTVEQPAEEEETETESFGLVAALEESLAKAKTN
jgi:DNA end-binding protein Ku